MQLFVDGREYSPQDTMYGEPLEVFDKSRRDGAEEVVQHWNEQVRMKGEPKLTAAMVRARRLAWMQ